MTMPVHQGDDGVEDFQSRPPAHEGAIDSAEEERSMEPQAEEDVRNSSGLRNRKIKPSHPEEDVRYPSELGNGKEKSSRPGREPDGVKRGLLRFRNELMVICFWLMDMCTGIFASYGILSVLLLLVVLCSRSFSGDLYVKQHEDSKDLHQKISEIRIVETPLRSVRSVAQDGTGVFKLARHDFLLLRTAGDKWYKAEKLGPSSGQAGIHFYPVTGPGVEVIRFRSSISVDFSLAQALDILADHELDYSLWGENCWKYAHSRAEAILNSCIEIASDDNVRNELKKELENLMDVRRRMPNEVVDVVEHWNIWGVLFCFIAVFIRYWVGFGKDLVRRPSSFYGLAGLSSMLIVVSFMRDQNPILLSYDLTWLATTYRWLCNCLSFFGYYVGWTVQISALQDLVAEVQIFWTKVSGREDLEITIFGAKYHQDNSMEDHRPMWRSWNRGFGAGILRIVIDFEHSLGYSRGITFLRSVFVGLLVGVLARKRFLHG